MELYYQVKVSCLHNDDVGNEKKITESCIVTAVSVSGAEEKVVRYYLEHVGAADVVVKGVTEAAISTVVSVKEKDIVEE